MLRGANIPIQGETREILIKSICINQKIRSAQIEGHSMKMTNQDFANVKVMKQKETVTEEHQGNMADRGNVGSLVGLQKRNIGFMRKAGMIPKHLCFGE